MEINGNFCYSIGLRSSKQMAQTNIKKNTQINLKEET